jgi:hypothetical protein
VGPRGHRRRHHRRGDPRGGGAARQARPLGRGSGLRVGHLEPLDQARPRGPALPAPGPVPRHAQVGEGARAPHERGPRPRRRPRLLRSPRSPATRCPSGCLRHGPDAMYDALAWKWAHEKYSREGARRGGPAARRVRRARRLPLLRRPDRRRAPRAPRHARGRARGRHGAELRAVTSACCAPPTATSEASCCSDTAPGGTRTAEVEATVVINATGAWADESAPSWAAPKRLRKHSRQPPHLPAPTACPCRRP